MYFVKYGKSYLHDPRMNRYNLLDLSLSSEENSCGYCDFTIYSDHPMYDKLKERDSDNPIEVYDDDILLFSGFIYELGKEFYLDGHVKCKGELDYLNDSIVRPYSTHKRGYGNKAPDTVNEYFKWLIDQHNAQTKSSKHFTVGINQGNLLDANNYLFRENDQYPSTIDEISEKLINNPNIGGYLVTRHENGVRYIDYLSEWTSSNTQILDFGVNLTDYTQTDDAAGVATFIVPLGAKISETEYKYNDGYFVTADRSPNPNKEYYTKSDSSYSKCSDLKSFESGVTYYEYNEDNDESDLCLTIDGLDDVGTGDPDYIKSGDMIYCASAVKKYGWIGATYKNTDITEKRSLMSKGIIELKNLISPKRTIEIKAVDIHMVNPDIKPIRIGEYVRVRSKPHKLDSYFLCRNIDLDLNNPENSLYTLGDTYDTLTGQQNKKINALNSAINQQYDTVTSISKEAKEVAKTASNTAGQAYTVASEAKGAADNAVTYVTEEYAISLSPTSAPTKGWSTKTPEYTNDVFVWHRMITRYGDGSKVVGNPAILTGNDGKDSVLLRIDSSRGTVFKNSSISTVLSAVIYKGSHRITDITELHEVFGNKAYLQWYWQKIDDDEFGVISSSDDMIGNNGFTLTISADKVDTKVTFKCELII